LCFLSIRTIFNIFELNINYHGIMVVNRDGSHYAFISSTFILLFQKIYANFEYQI